MSDYDNCVYNHNGMPSIRYRRRIMFCACRLIGYDIPEDVATAYIILDKLFTSGLLLLIC